MADGRPRYALVRAPAQRADRLVTFRLLQFREEIERSFSAVIVGLDWLSRFVPWANNEQDATRLHSAGRLPEKPLVLVPVKRFLLGSVS